VILREEQSKLIIENVAKKIVPVQNLDIQAMGHNIFGILPLKAKAMLKI